MRFILAVGAGVLFPLFLSVIVAIRVTEAIFPTRDPGATSRWNLPDPAAATGQPSAAVANPPDAPDTPALSEVAPELPNVPAPGDAAPTRAGGFRAVRDPVPAAEPADATTRDMAGPEPAGEIGLALAPEASGDEPAAPLAPEDDVVDAVETEALPVDSIAGAPATGLPADGTVAAAPETMAQVPELTALGAPSGGALELPQTDGAVARNQLPFLTYEPRDGDPGSGRPEYGGASRLASLSLEGLRPEGIFTTGHEGTVPSAGRGTDPLELGPHDILIPSQISPPPAGFPDMARGRPAGERLAARTADTAPGAATPVPRPRQKVVLDIGVTTAPLAPPQPEPETAGLERIAALSPARRAPGDTATDATVAGLGDEHQPLSRSGSGLSTPEGVATGETAAGETMNAPDPVPPVDEAPTLAGPFEPAPQSPEIAAIAPLPRPLRPAAGGAPVAGSAADLPPDAETDTAPPVELAAPAADNTVAEPELAALAPEPRPTASPAPETPAAAAPEAAPELAGPEPEADVAAAAPTEAVRTEAAPEVVPEVAEPPSELATLPDLRPSPRPERRMALALQAEPPVSADPGPAATSSLAQPVPSVPEAAPGEAPAEAGAPGSALAAVPGLRPRARPDAAIALARAVRASDALARTSEADAARPRPQETQEPELVVRAAAPRTPSRPQPAVTPAAPAAPRAGDAAAVVVGVFDLGQESWVLVRRPGGDIRELRVGQSIGGARVQSIRGKSVQVQWQNRLLTLGAGDLVGTAR